MIVQPILVKPTRIRRCHAFNTRSVARSFIHWVEDGWPGWLEQHVEAHVSIAGTVLGVPKAVSAILSGLSMRIDAPFLSVFVRTSPCV